MEDEGTNHQWVRSASKIFENEEVEFKKQEERRQSQRFDSLRVSTDEEPAGFIDIEGLINSSYSPKVPLLYIC